MPAPRTLQLRPRRWLPWALALALTPACVSDVVFDPIGTEWTIAGSWLVNGAPPSASTCAAAGIDFVRVRFFDVSRTADHPRLVFPCAQGSFDTRPEALVASGTWSIALVAIDAEGNAMAMATPQTFEPVDVRGHVELGTADFVVP
jgi:hypothetical protein